jgi:NADH:ubiquinone oxidoreductase subunit E
MEIKFCMGTMCYVMGGAELRAAAEELPPELADKVTVKHSPCLGVCDKPGAQPPYVEIDGEIVGGMTRHSLLQIIKETIDAV